MKEITEKEGKELINSHQAGWYAVYANPPIPHDKQIVVTVDGRWFLLQVPDEMEIKLLHTVPITETHGKGIFALELKSDEITALIKPKLERLEKGPEMMPNVPTYIGGKADHPDLRN